MSSAAFESEATLAARVEELKIGQHLPVMRTLGFRKMVNFEYGTDYVLGVGNPDAFLNDIIIPILGTGGATNPHRFVRKRLFFEGYTQAQQTLRSGPPPARMMRLSRPRQSRGSIAGHSSRAGPRSLPWLANWSQHTKSRNELSDLAGDLCTNRDQELGGVKRELTSTVDPVSKNLKQSEGSAVHQADW